MKTVLGDEEFSISKATIRDLLLICVSSLKSGGNNVEFDIPLGNGEIYERVHINMTFELFE